MRRTDDVSLWPWPLTLKLVRNVARVVEFPPANAGDTTTTDVCINAIIQTSMLQLFVVVLWAIGGGRASVAGSRRHRYRLITYSSKCCYLYGGNWQITVFRRQNSRFRKRFSKIGLSYNVAVPHYNIACKLDANWYWNGRAIRQPAVRGKFALEDMPQDVCQH